jgi:uncharacterized repeat protein (TIGR03833 family)
MSVPNRSDIKLGQQVRVVEKQNQGTGALTDGVVARILTKSPTHPHGIKVMLADGRVGRVESLVGQDISGMEGIFPELTLDKIRDESDR